MPVTPKIDQQEMAAHYGWALAVLRSNGELSKLFDRAVANSYSAARFVAELRNTTWYKTHSESARQYDVLKKADPAEWNRRRAASRAQLSEQYYQLTGRKLGGVLLWRMADQALQFGFNETEIRDVIGRSFRTENLMKYGGLGGTLGEAERQLRQAKEDYGIGFSDNAIARQLNAIATQDQDVTSTVAYYRKQALSKYAGFKNELMSGQTVRDIAEPYKQLMAKLLEVSDRSVSTNDALIQRALMYRPSTPDGKVGPPAEGGMPLWEFEQQLRNDPRWVKTQNAQDDVMSVGRKVLEDMGMIAGGGS